jgi:hypothetical protein
MPYPHVIRLRGPWEFEVLEREAASCAESPAKLTGKATLPCDWSDALGADFRGQVRYRRRFNRPSGLDPHERVWLVIEGVDAFGSATLNGRALGEIRGYALPASFDVTNLLGSGNELKVDVELPPVLPSGNLRPGAEGRPGGPIGEVRLEIRSSAFIERLAIWTSCEAGAKRLHVSGRARGEASGPLAVVVSGAERELFYGEVECGAPFQFADVVQEIPAWPHAAARGGTLDLQIKLLSGGVSRWQCVRAAAAADVNRSESGELLVRGALTHWPIPVIDLPASTGLPGALWQAALAPRNLVVALRQILPETSYADFDRAGQAVVQIVPIAWAEEVCLQRAHHPAIVAWSASSAELAQAGEQRLQSLSFGRPWIASERVIGASLP